MPTISPLPPPRRPETASSAPIGAAPAAAPVALERTPAPTVLPNPALRLDASLGLVVLEFRDADGQPRTIPSQRELDAYREAARSARQVAEERPPAAQASQGGEVPGAEAAAESPADGLPRGAASAPAEGPSRADPPPAEARSRGAADPAEA